MSPCTLMQLWSTSRLHLGARALLVLNWSISLLNHSKPSSGPTCKDFFRRVMASSLSPDSALGHAAFPAWEPVRSAAAADSTSERCDAVPFLPRLWQFLLHRVRGADPALGGGAECAGAECASAGERRDDRRRQSTTEYGSGSPQHQSDYVGSGSSARTTYKTLSRHRRSMIA